MSTVLQTRPTASQLLASQALIKDWPGQTRLAAGRWVTAADHSQSDVMVTGHVDPGSALFAMDAYARIVRRWTRVDDPAAGPRTETARRELIAEIRHRWVRATIIDGLLELVDCPSDHADAVAVTTWGEFPPT